MKRCQTVANNNITKRKDLLLHQQNPVCCALVQEQGMVHQRYLDQIQNMIIKPGDGCKKEKMVRTT